MNNNFILLFLLISVFTYAQDTKWSIQISQSPGKLIKHSKNMKFSPSGTSEFTEIDFTYHTQGIHDWEKYYNLPRIGLGIRYLFLGQPSNIIGDGYSFFPFIDFGYSQKNQSSFRFKIGTGLAYLKKTYQIKLNPSQTAIGSHWNNLTTFQFIYEHSLYTRNLISAGISLSHISNGAFKAPNLGLNFISAIFGYSFHFKPSTLTLVSKPIDNPTAQSTITSESLRFLSAFSLSIEYGMTLKEGTMPGGPKFLIQWYMLDVGYQYNEFESWRLNFELERNNLDSYSASFSEIRESKKAAFRDGIRFNTYLAHQWLFGNIGLTFRTGYEYKLIKDLTTFPIVTKLDLCYIIPFQLIPSIRPYIGVSLKAHLNTAEYIGAMAGFRFYKKS